jgi:uncharacterized protein (TIGR03545 family)
MLEMRGDFPTAKIMGVKAIVTIDHTKAIGRQTALIHVNSFGVPEKMFVDDPKLKFGFKNAIGTSTINASMVENNIKMSWNSALTKPQFIIESSSKIAKDMFSNVLNSIPVININGSATGTFSDLNLDISSNLGDELGQGFSREIGLKVTEAQDKVKSLIDEKINKPKDELMASISGNNKNLSSLTNVKELYAKNEDRIKAEIEKLKKGGGMDSLKDQGKKLFKGIKF